MRLPAIAALCIIAAPAMGQVQLVQNNRKGLLTLQHDGETVWTYVMKPQEEAAKLPVKSVAYFHPVLTPGGELLTEVAPADHPHHRGVFLAFVEMHGTKDADFWGWGQPAPINERTITHDTAGMQQVGGGKASLKMTADWTAEGHTMLRQSLVTTTQPSAHVSPESPAGVHVIDLTYTLTPMDDLTLSRWAFSGFCYRGRGEGEFTVHGPGGEITLPNPSHKDPATDWPDAPWYDAVTKLPAGKTVGMAVMSHPANPPTLWHNHRKIRMINPCIVAPGELKLKKDQPLVLRYRLVAHDGPTPAQLLNRLADEFRAAK